MSASNFVRREARLMSERMGADHRSCTGPCAHGECVRCCYRPNQDKATSAEHANACRERLPFRAIEYTADPACSNRTWHHNATWCDVCKGVA